MIKCTISMTDSAYQNCGQHRCYKCPDGICSIPIRQPTAGFEMEEEKTDQSVCFTITFWVQHINCTLSGILLMNMLLQICKDNAKIMHRAVLQHPAEWASHWPAVLRCHATVRKITNSKIRNSYLRVRNTIHCCTQHSWFGSGATKSSQSGDILALYTNVVNLLHVLPCCMAQGHQ